MYYVMTIYEVATRAPKVCTVFPLRQGILLFFFLLLRVSSGGHFAAWELRKIEELEIRLHVETTAFLLVRLLVA